MSEAGERQHKEVLDTIREILNIASDSTEMTYQLKSELCAEVRRAALVMIKENPYIKKS